MSYVYNENKSILQKYDIDIAFLDVTSVGSIVHMEINHKKFLSITKEILKR